MLTNHPPQTDGFGDNIFLREMASILSLSQKHDLPDELMPQFMADRLVDRAHQTMYSGRVTPFQSEWGFLRVEPSFRYLSIGAN